MVLVRTANMAAFTSPAVILVTVHCLVDMLASSPALTSVHLVRDLVETIVNTVNVQRSVESLVLHAWSLASGSAYITSAPRNVERCATDLGVTSRAVRSWSVVTPALVCVVRGAQSIAESAIRLKLKKCFLELKMKKVQDSLNSETVVMC